MRLGDIYALCFVPKTVSKYIEKENIKLSCVCLPEDLPPTCCGDTSTVTPPQLLPCDMVMLGKSRGPGAGSSWDRLLVHLLLPLLPLCQETHGSLQASAGWCVTKTKLLFSLGLSRSSLHQALFVWEFV